ncbi:hypothetical protein [Streptomyces genisteinicus]|nr:hypothetical protein [Streptomyces genisteinicus]
MHHKPDDGTNHRERTGSEGTDGAKAERRIELSVPQVAGSVLAAVTAAILASQLGVYGTIVGAGVVSVVATCGGPLLQHVFKRTGEQLKEATAHARTGAPAAPSPAGASAADPARPAPRPGEFGAPSTYGARRRGWKRPVAAAAVVFGVAMGGITVYEVAAGQEIGGGTGTTVGSAFRPGGDGADRGGTGRTDPADERPDRDGRDGAGTDDGSTDGGDPDGGASQPSPAPSAGSGDGTGPGDGGASPEPSGDGTSPAPSPSSPEPGATTPAPGTSPSGAPSDGATAPGAGDGTGGR